jgi:hypothetical protein
VLLLSILSLAVEAARRWLRMAVKEGMSRFVRLSVGSGLAVHDMVVVIGRCFGRLV